MAKNNENIPFIPVIIIAAVVALITTLLVGSMSSGAQTDSAELEETVSEYIINNPVIIADAMRKAYEIQQQEEEKKAKSELIKQKDKLVGDEGSPWVGNPDGDVVLVEFFDYNCGFCKRALGDINAVLEADDNVKVVFKELGILGELSVKAAKASIAAFMMDKDKYWEFHQTLLNSGARTPTAINDAAKKSGYDVAAFTKKMDSKEVNEQLDAHSSLAASVGVRGTPAFVVGDALIRGAQGKDALLEAIAAARK